jgi:hypothetical protein
MQELELGNIRKGKCRNHVACMYKKQISTKADIRREMKVETPQETFLKLQIGWYENMWCQQNNIFVSIKYRDVE